MNNSKSVGIPILAYVTIAISLIGVFVLSFKPSLGLTIIFMAILIYGAIAIRDRLQQIGAEAFALGSVLVWLGFVLLALPLIAFAWDFFETGRRILLFIGGLVLIIFGYTTEYFELNALFYQWLINTRDTLIEIKDKIKARFLKSIWTSLATVTVLYAIVGLLYSPLLEILPNPGQTSIQFQFIRLILLAGLFLLFEFREAIWVLTLSLFSLIWFLVKAMLIRLQRFPDFLQQIFQRIINLGRSMVDWTKSLFIYFTKNTFVLAFGGFIIFGVIALVAPNDIFGASSLILLLVGMTSALDQRQEQIADRVARVQQTAYSSSFKVRNLVKGKSKGQCLNCEQELLPHDIFCPNCRAFVPSCLVCKRQIHLGEETLQCAECKYIGHRDHLENWISIKPICPNCKTTWT